MTLYYQQWKSPIGKLHMVASDKALLVLSFDSNWGDQKKRLKTKMLGESNSIIEKTKRQLQEYVDGKRKTFDIPLSVKGTDFQVDAWNALQKIPFGETRSYGEQAKLIRRPKAVRAIGAANSQNPISIIIPCHRVIGKSGSLTGYAGGLGNKMKLLVLEGAEV